MDASGYMRPMKPLVILGVFSMRRELKDKKVQAISKALLADADTVYRMWLNGRRNESARVRRSLIRRLRRHLRENRNQVRLWCLLGDLYTFRKKRLECFRRAVGADPNDAEANAEIAELYAEQGNPRYAMHLDRALQNCRGVEIEDSIIYSALEAARKAKDQGRTEKALRLGRRRFPDSLFG